MPSGALGQHADGRVGVDHQLNLRHVLRCQDDAADQAVRIHDGIIDLNPGSRAAIDDDRLEAARCVEHDRFGHRRRHAELFGVSEEAAQPFEIAFGLAHLQILGRQLDHLSMQLQVFVH